MFGLRCNKTEFLHFVDRINHLVQNLDSHEVKFFSIQLSNAFTSAIKINLKNLIKSCVAYGDVLEFSIGTQRKLKEF